jgi:hypothetical protein
VVVSGPRLRGNGTISWLRPTEKPRDGCSRGLGVLFQVTPRRAGVHPASP